MYPYTLPIDHSFSFLLKSCLSCNLSQAQGCNIIVFLSRTMQAAKRNYEIYDKELLVLVKALTKWKQYLQDTMKKFEV